MTILSENERKFIFNACSKSRTPEFISKHWGYPITLVRKIHKDKTLQLAQK